VAAGWIATLALLLIRWVHLLLLPLLLGWQRMLHVCCALAAQRQRGPLTRQLQV
jgi:hypothetical protein